MDEEFRGLVDTNKRLPSWVVFWKEVGSDSCEFDLPLLWFGISASPEEALEKVDRRAKGDPFWAQKWARGVFYALGTHQGLVIKRWRR